MFKSDNVVQETRESLSILSIWSVLLTGFEWEAIKGWSVHFNKGCSKHQENNFSFVIIADIDSWSTVQRPNDDDDRLYNTTNLFYMSAYPSWQSIEEPVNQLSVVLSTLASRVHAPDWGACPDLRAWGGVLTRTGACHWAMSFMLASPPLPNRHPLLKPFLEEIRRACHCHCHWCPKPGQRDKGDRAHCHHEQRDQAERSALSQFLASTRSLWSSCQCEFMELKWFFLLPVLQCEWTVAKPCTVYVSLTLLNDRDWRISLL